MQINHLVAMASAICVAFGAAVPVEQVDNSTDIAGNGTDTCPPYQWLLSMTGLCDVATGKAGEGDQDGYTMCVGACIEKPAGHCNNCLASECAQLYDGGPGCCFCRC